MRARKHTPESDSHGIDLAPMLDFVLNLLIFFFITTSFVKESGITVARPDADTAEHKESGNILISVRENGDVWMDRRQVDLREVRLKLRPDLPLLDVTTRAGRLTGATLPEGLRLGAENLVLATREGP